MVAPGASVAATAITVPSTSGASGAGGPPEPVQPGAGAAPDPGVQVIQAKTEDGKTAAIELEAPRGWEIVRPPTSPDPHGGKFTLKEALAGLGGAGSLVARIQTSLGSLYCDLFDGKVPNTVANFVGLARGKRKFWDENAQAWVARPFYPGTTFHRVVPGAYIHGGDPTGTGRGRIGYMIPNEFHPSLSQDRGGRLCMAQRAANTNGAQFFVTESAVRDYEGRFSIFGQCQPLALVARIAHAPQSGPPAFRPVQPVVIEVVEVKRVAGGAAAWMPASAARAAEKAMPPGVVPEGRAVQVDDDEDDDVR
jgi:peptidyl-prolyl cis-trans isomerase A (cyclophilin A)